MAYRRLSDGSNASAAEALDANGHLRVGFARDNAQRFLQPGDYIGFDLALLDAAPVPAVRLALRDTAGAPMRLHDATSGATLQLTDHLIAAIENEARREGMTVDRYVADVLRYSPAPVAPTTR